MRTHTVVVLAKSPQPGFAKTRLQPLFSPPESAALASAAIRDTLDAATSADVRRVVVAWDGPPVRWLPDGVCVLPQRGSSLDERLEHVFEDLLDGLDGFHDQPTVLVGMDTPQLTAPDLDIDWAHHDAVLGMSEDGGYWAIGFRRYVRGAITGVPMSTDDTGELQLRRLRSLHLDVGLLPRMRDVDTPSDAAQVSLVAPDSRFGRLHRRLVERPCSPVTLFDAALAGHPVEVLVDGRPDGIAVLPASIDPAAWLQLSRADELLVSRCEGPVLDVGCGPGRFVEALALRGLPALGVDLSRGAVQQTRDRGAAALLRDVHDRLPAEGRWGTVLLADGNIGIGGDPLGLLLRCREILRPGAAALVETCADPDEDRRATVTLRGPGGRTSTGIPWAVVGSRALVRLAAQAGFVAVEDWHVGGRAFMMLRQAA